MTTLTQITPLLDRLFREAQGLSPFQVPEVAALSSAERTRLTHELMQSKTQYRELYGLLKDIPLPVSPETGRLLYLLARSTHAKHIVEYGTSFGVSTLHLAAALRDNGGGRLITTEFEPGKVARARQHLEEAGLADLVEIREGDALETLQRDLPAEVDLLLLDGAKALYREVLELVEPH
ncbi:MAG: class I SAM-dependent methyltransferase, partial [Myxococcales bacterium]|nr:class I SAM-dependent methyltransferase [Myxococcales bacterium]